MFIKVINIKGLYILRRFIVNGAQQQLVTTFKRKSDFIKYRIHLSIQPHNVCVSESLNKLA